MAFENRKFTEQEKNEISKRRISILTKDETNNILKEMINRKKPVLS